MCNIKKCTKCGEEKSLDYFGKSKRTKDEKQPQCKSCVNNQKALKNSTRVLPTYDSKDSKICSSCKEEKLMSCFSNCNSNMDGKMYECRNCRKKYHTPKKEGVKIFSDIEERICTKCKIIKPFSEFLSSTKTVIGVSSVCKNCACEARKVKKEEAKEIPDFKVCTKCELLKSRESFVKDASKSDGISCKCKQCTNKHRVERTKTDIIFKLSLNVRRTILTSFKNCVKGNYKKDKISESILGMSFENFKNHIECQFINRMGWDKHGLYDGVPYTGFDLDHIIPISYAKTEEEIYLLNHWSNFQPLCSKVNRDIKKGQVYPCTNLELRITFWEDHYEYI